MATPSIAEPGAATVPHEAVRAPAVGAARKQAASSALSLLPAFIDRLRWGRLDAAAELIDQMSAALEASHPAIAARIRRQRTLQATPISMPKDVVDLEEPTRKFDDVVMPANIEKAVMDIVDEHRHADELAKFHLKPRHRVLLDGPPGNGKTMLAEAFACELGVPLLRANYAGLLDSHLGESGKNLSKLFQYAGNGPCVLFLDELDGIAASRDSSDVGEMRRITNQLLILIDRTPAHCVLVCATNLPGTIDKALMRRFDFRLHLPAPDRERIQRCARKELAPSLTPGHDISILADTLASRPFPNLASVSDRCCEIRRDLVLNRGRAVTEIASRDPD
ncbi:ATP-binding protein [Paraburkholderia sp. J8-2]|uniref:AAA family ATPase n=1 Tax=Paraburkholderia sp. J8-2 TaxID=2805440 RepID=UPI002AB71237|nr:ATP-binding protein [Paraburkholderia sp. J8-2]